MFARKFSQSVDQQIINDVLARVKKEVELSMVKSDEERK